MIDSFVLVFFLCSVAILLEYVWWLINRRDCWARISSVERMLWFVSWFEKDTYSIPLFYLLVRERARFRRAGTMNSQATCFWTEKICLHFLLLTLLLLVFSSCAMNSANEKDVFCLCGFLWAHCFLTQVERCFEGLSFFLQFLFSRSVADESRKRSVTPSVCAPSSSRDGLVLRGRGSGWRRQKK
jgi:hypothetical protein